MDDRATGMVIALSFFIGMFSALLISMNYGGINKYEYENCQTACEVNSEVKRCYADGDCLCSNGAFFDASDIRQVEKK